MKSVDRPAVQGQPRTRRRPGAHAGRRHTTRRPGPREAAASRREQLLFVRYQRDGDLAARSELVERFLPLAYKLAARYRGRSEPYEDLVQVASVGLVKAIDRFQPDRGSDFVSYAAPTILGELKRYFRDSGWALHLPRSMQERVMALDRAVERLSADLGSSPTPAQVAVEMGLSVEDVLEAMVAAAGYGTVSLEAPTRSSDGDGAAINDALGASDEGFELAEHRTALDRALRALDGRERSIVHLRFAEDLTQAEIAQRLGISQMHVSRLIRRSLERLRLVVGEE
jgi:RNA polymerase sigma-B factor